MQREKIKAPHKCAMDWAQFRPCGEGECYAEVECRYGRRRSRSNAASTCPGGGDDAGVRLIVVGCPTTAMSQRGRAVHDETRQRTVSPWSRRYAGPHTKFRGVYDRLSPATISNIYIDLRSLRPTVTYRALRDLRIQCVPAVSYRVLSS